MVFEKKQCTLLPRPASDFATCSMGLGLFPNDKSVVPSLRSTVESCRAGLLLAAAKVTGLCWLPVVYSDEVALLISAAESRKSGPFWACIQLNRKLLLSIFRTAPPRAAFLAPDSEAQADRD